MERQLINQLCRDLAELHEMVWAEAPHLLDQDRGGTERLDLSIDDSLEEARKYLEATKINPTSGTH